ncbi:unnamed protein product [Clonostachys rhizophaga]|uniref:GH16 domain-containing protein n=1 Tax=Clonostachys rhizophaga TaxID=160324 RepID=A0A9N9YAY3_9HYPO|nr:unnamed protein product [Clonostachys rhizophaga]
MYLFRLLSGLATIALVTADCECGYRARNSTHHGEEWMFTEALETDFSDIHDLSGNTDWIRQGFNVSAEDGRGGFGKSFKPSNVEARPASGGSIDGNANDAGVALRVSSTIEDNLVLSAELDSSRLDLHWGSYRASMKLPQVPGTCAAFFWYFNDTQEIDMEFLSAQFDYTNNVYPLSLVVQSRQSKMAGYDATKTGTYRRVNLTFNPTLGFHEYRIDYLPGKVAFYADSQLLVVMQGEEMPTRGGHMILQHWSNGNPLWSGGPPKSDSLMIVRYVKAYFNSSNPDHLKRQLAACRNEGMTLKDTCLIPDGTAGDAVSGGKSFLKTTDASTKETENSDNDRSDKERGTATSSRAGGIAHSGFVLAMVLFLLEA